MSNQRHAIDVLDGLWLGDHSEKSLADLYERAVWPDEVCEDVVASEIAVARFAEAQVHVDEAERDANEAFIAGRRR